MQGMNISIIIKTIYGKLSKLITVNPKFFLILGNVYKNYRSAKKILEMSLNLV